MLHSVCQQILKTQQWPQDQRRSVFISIPKKGNAKECSNYHTFAFIPHANKVKVAQSCPTLCDLMDYTVHRILQPRILEWVAFPFSRGSSQHVNKVMLKILQARLQQYMNWQLPDVQSGFRKSRGARDQIANIHWIIEKAREFAKNLLLLHWLY